MGETIPQIDRNTEFFPFFFFFRKVLYSSNPLLDGPGLYQLGDSTSTCIVSEICGYVMYVYMMMYYIYTLDLFNHIVKVQTHHYINGYRLMNACLLPLCEPVRQTGLRAHTHTQTSTQVYKFSQYPHTELVIQSRHVLCMTSCGPCLAPQVPNLLGVRPDSSMADLTRRTIT